MADIQMIEIDAIKRAPFNPPNRVEQRKLKQLRLSIERVGLLYPLLVTSDYELIDGHRRLACVVELGWTHVPARVHDGDLELLWTEVNSFTAPIKAASWVQAVNLGFAIDHVPAMHRARIELARQWLGEDGVKLLAERSKSTDVVKQAQNVARYIDEDSDEMKGKILIWIVQHEMAFNVHNYMVGRQPSELIREAIMADKPITRGWAII